MLIVQIDERRVHAKGRGVILLIDFNSMKIYTHPETKRSDITRKTVSEALGQIKDECHFETIPPLKGPWTIIHKGENIHV